MCDSYGYETTATPEFKVSRIMRACLHWAALTACRSAAMCCVASILSPHAAASPRQAWVSEQSAWLKPYAAFCYLKDLFQVQRREGEGL